MEKNLRGKKKIRLDKNDKPIEKNLTNDGISIEILNDDCLLHVFEYLPIFDRIRLERVNKQWCAVSRMSWRSFKTMNFHRKLWGSEAVINRKALKNVLLLCGEYVKTWDMTEFQNEFSVMMSETIYMDSVLKLCPNLTSVDFSSGKVNGPMIQSLLQCKNMTNLNLGKLKSSATKYFTNGTILSSFANLQILCIESDNSYCTFMDLSFAGNWIQFQNNNSIKELRLDCCYGLDRSNIASTVLQLPNLHTLSLRGSLDNWYTPWDLSFIERSSIKVLDISKNPACVNDNFLEQNTMAFTHLTDLYIGNNNVTDHGLRAVTLLSDLEFLNIDALHVKGSSLSNLPKLKWLSCQGCSRLIGKYFQTFFDTSDELEVIDLRRTRYIEYFEDIFSAAKISLKSRINETTLRMYVDKSSTCYGLYDIPDNLKVFEMGCNTDIPE